MSYEDVFGCVRSACSCPGPFAELIEGALARRYEGAQRGLERLGPVAFAQELPRAGEALAGALWALALYGPAEQGAEVAYRLWLEGLRTRARAG